jgi:hypothetical protein
MFEGFYLRIHVSLAYITIDLIFLYLFVISFEQDMID